jgi:hypothetical protein
MKKEGAKLTSRFDRVISGGTAFCLCQPGEVLRIDFSKLNCWLNDNLCVASQKSGIL